MELYYEGTNITDSVNITAATAKDVSGGRSDSLDITMSNARAWYHWGPRADDKIQIVDNGYSTGTMYVNTIIPEGDSFRILATAAKSEAARKASRSYERKNLEEIMALCAAECGMDYRIFGADRKNFYPFLLRSQEGCGAFLDRLAGWEGAKLKTYSGRFTLISIEAAQNLPAIETIEVSEKQPGIFYQRKGNGRIKTLTVRTPYARAHAVDEGTRHGRDMTVNYPARDAATAGRWARGMLLNLNREAEQLTVESEFHPAWTAMARVDTTGHTDATGQWIVDECEHDLVNRTSKAVMLRCINTVV